MKFLDFSALLAQRAEQGLMRQRITLDSPQQAHVTVAGDEFLNFASNDYLGLASSSCSRSALGDSAQEYGFGSGASHLICGHQAPHDALEKQFAEFLQRDKALCFASGYMANLALLQSLARKNDLIVADKLNHASLIDGVRLSQADSVRYPHCDLAALERRLQRSGQNTFVVTDSVFSMDGDIAPLIAISELCERHKAVLIVDDAHGFGVLGEHGRGIAEHFALGQKQLPVIMSTLGKALGGYGACVTGEAALIDYLEQTARSYVYTTAMPAAIAAGNLANLQKLQRTPELVSRLREKIVYFRRLCQESGIDLLQSETAIQPFMIGDNEALLSVNEHLRAAKILVGAIRPPTVPKGSARLRITLSAAHDKQDIDYLVTQLALVTQKLGKGTTQT